MPKSLTPHLMKLKEEIEGYARAYGLDFFESLILNNHLSFYRVERLA